VSSLTHEPAVPVPADPAAGFDRREVDVIVVGAGHNGLTAACYLARAGMDVLVVEAGEQVGGMTATNATLPEAPEHRFNEGAIQLTGIFRLSGIAQELDLARYGLREVPVDPAHLQLGPDGTSLGIWKDRERTARELERYSRADAKAWRELSGALDAVMPAVLAYMCSHPTRVLSIAMVKSLLAGARHVGKLRPLASYTTASLTEMLDETFETELPKGAIAAMAVFERMGADMSAVVALLYLGIIQRIPNAMPIGGTGELPKALAACLLAHRGRVRTSAPVEKILVKRSRTTGVRLVTGEHLWARVGVVAACNARITLLDLLAEDVLPKHLRTRASDIPITKTAATSLKINVALSGRITAPRHAAMRDDGLDPLAVLSAWHTAAEQSRAWDACWRGEWPEPVPVCCCISPTHVDHSQGPEGQDTFWLWSGVVPVHPRVPWESVRDDIGRKVLADCAQYFEGIESLEIGRTVLGGPDIEARFHAPAGNVYHVDPIPTRFGPFKPAWGLGGYRTPIEGLFLSGASTHPTGGVCALPGKLAAQTLLRDNRKGTPRARRHAHA
jgi:phytoene dehydrogenase-like protein